MATALISIGVGKTGGEFHMLSGAPQDARAFHNWGLAQGFDCKLLTDDEQKLRGADVYDAIFECVHKGIYSQLIVYFSGHGVLKAPDCEFWLMSGAPDNPNEAINVCGSVQAARSSGIPHIVFVSDACRTLPEQMRTAAMTGSVVFPYFDVRRAPLPEVDIFYATIPGDVAMEARADTEHPRDRGVLTQCLLDALVGKVPQVIHAHPNLGEKSCVVPCRPLKEWLISAVPSEAQRIAWHLQQTPDIRIESALPKYLSKLDLASDGMAMVPEQMESITRAPGDYVDPRRRMRLMPSRASGQPAGDRFGVVRKKSRGGIRESVAEAPQSWVGFDVAPAFSGRGGFGLVVHGSDVLSVRSAAGSLSSGLGMLNHWRRFPAFVEPQPFSVRLPSGDGIVLPLIPGYVATVNVSDGNVTSVRYGRIQSAETGKGAEGPSQIASERMLARLEAKAKSGLLSAADVLSANGKTFLPMLFGNPMAVVYAGYALSRSGQFDHLHRLADAVREVFGFIPFDLALLADQHEMAEFPALAPGVPLLTQGWFMLGRFEARMPPKLAAARGFMHSSLWATFRAEGMDLLEDYIFGG